MAKSTSLIVAGAITWAEELDGYLLVTVTDARGKRDACAVAINAPLATAIMDARINMDGVAITVLHHGIDLDNVHDQRPSREAIAIDVTWRSPRLGETGPWGWMDRDNVVALAETTPMTPATALPLAA